ncbi:MAG TPA: hypothetical protein DDW54_03870 [Clostridiales bacterium]|nr:hypothetical protein [Clostridiales bacterium]
MPLLESVFTKLGFGDEITPCPYRYTVLGGKAAVIEGVKTVLSLSEEEIIFSVGKNRLKIAGKGLEIKKYGEKEASVSGFITGVYCE